MGCRHSKNATLIHRASVAMPLHPTTPSFHEQDSKPWAATGDSQPVEELPSFVVSDSVDLVGSSDGEPVHGMISAFNFSFIHLSESGSNSSLSSPSVTGELVSPVPSDMSTFAVTGDPLELLPIPEERLESRDCIEVPLSLSAESTETPRQSGNTEPDGEASPASVTLNDENSGVSDSAVTETSDMLIKDLDNSGISQSSDNDSNSEMNSVAMSLMSEYNEYIVTETGVVVCQEPHKRSDVLAHDSVQLQSIQESVAAIVRDIVDGAVTAATSTQNQVCSRAAFESQSSIQVEPSSSGVFTLSIKTKPVDNRSSRRSMYAVVGTSFEKGIVQYHVQLLNDSTEPVPLHRRYSRFIEMYLKLKESKLPSAGKLPQLSRAGVTHFIRGRQSRKTIEERQNQFSSLLRYVAEHQELHDSTAFQNFLAQ
ncbi:putative Phox domain, PX domain superfamily protein [Plasmopara halstedii]